jgi:hypothetical protein
VRARRPDGEFIGGRRERKRERWSLVFVLCHRLNFVVEMREINTLLCVS